MGVKNIDQRSGLLIGDRASSNENSRPKVGPYRPWGLTPWSYDYGAHAPPSPPAVHPRAKSMCSAHVHSTRRSLAFSAPNRK